MLSRTRTTLVKRQSCKTSTFQLCKTSFTPRSRPSHSDPSPRRSARSACSGWFISFKYKFALTTKTMARASETKQLRSYSGHRAYSPLHIITHSIIHHLRAAVSMSVCLGSCAPRGSHGQSCSRVHLSTSRSPPVAASSHSRGPRKAVLSRPLQRLQVTALGTRVDPPPPVRLAPRAPVRLGPRQPPDGREDISTLRANFMSVRHHNVLPFGKRGSPEASTATRHGRPTCASIVREDGSSRLSTSSKKRSGRAWHRSSSGHAFRSATNARHRATTRRAASTPAEGVDARGRAATAATRQLPPPPRVLPPGAARY